MIEDIIKKSSADFQKVIDHFKKELSGLRVGRATAALLDNVYVDYYGRKAGIQEMASISVSGPRLIVIQPWNKDDLASIEKAINASGIGLVPINDGNVVRLSVPQLTEERRKELVKLLGQRLEDARIGIRRERDESVRKIQQAEKNKEISEDEKFRAKDRIQKIVEEFNAKIEEIGKDKEKEIMTV